MFLAAVQEWGGGGLSPMNLIFAPPPPTNIKCMYVVVFYGKVGMHCFFKRPLQI